MYHTLIIVGNVGKDAEMRYTPAGQAVASFSVATSRTYTSSNGEKIKETVWFRVSTWGKQAEICKEYVHKGMKVLVEGRLTPDKSTGNPRMWTTSAGEPACSYEVNAQIVRFLPSSHSADEGGMVETAHEIGGVESEVEVPF
jgi:single-strand DNA-binding protein